MKKILWLLLICLALGAVGVPALGEDIPAAVSVSSTKQALQYIAENNVRDLNLGQVQFTPIELYNIQSALPAGGRLYFSTSWCGTTVTQDDDTIYLDNSKAQVTEEDLEALIALAPGVKKISLAKHRNLSNKQMIPLIEKYPEVEFVWLINFAGAYTVPSDATAFSTLKMASEGKRLSSAQLAPLKYCKNLKALDLGHHNITSLDFLTELTGLELLILADNDITDISVLGTMPNLQYVELFMNDFTDISPLANCKYLLDVNLSGLKITDLSPLDGCQYIQRLWANRCGKLTKEAQQHFIDTHPNALTDFEGLHATDDDWRKHDHYRHYFPLWESNTWVPFPDSPLLNGETEAE